MAESPILSGPAIPLDLERKVLRAEVVEQCFLAARAETYLEAALARDPLPPDPRIPGPGQALPEGEGPRFFGGDPVHQYNIEYRTDIMLAVQGVLQAASVVSTLLWDEPSGGKKPDQRRLAAATRRRKIIFDGIEVPVLPRLHSKIPRHFLVHIEDKFFDWLAEELGKDPDSKFGPLMVFSGPMGVRPDWHVYRCINKATLEFWAGGRHTNLRDLVNDMRFLSLVLPVQLRLDVPQTVVPPH
jgi:hypothetical protein